MPQLFTNISSSKIIIAMIGSSQESNRQLGKPILVMKSSSSLVSVRLLLAVYGAELENEQFLEASGCLE